MQLLKIFFLVIILFKSLNLSSQILQSPKEKKMPVVSKTVKQKPQTEVLVTDLSKAVQYYDEGHFSRAAKIFLENSNKMNGEQSFLLGAMYEFGQGVSQSYAKALYWYNKAAAKGYTNAMVFIGDMYQNKKGVDLDYSKAKFWYEKAAEMGDATAMTILGYMYSTGMGVKQSYADAIYWYEKATVKGESSAMYNLGTIYENGNYVIRNLDKAIMWYKRAAEKGNNDAKIALVRLDN